MAFQGKLPLKGYFALILSRTPADIPYTGSMKVIAQKYSILKELGNGGYGRVYLVKHIDLGLEYALKEMSQELSEDTQFIEFFRREAEILQKFSHPNSVMLRDFGRTEEGRYYMTQDFAPGRLLSQIIDESGSLPLAAALEVIEQVLDALHGAHQFGIIHRDIKAENIMVDTSTDGKHTVKVLDFGIAKLRQDHMHSHDAVDNAAGTPEYMSPEQVSGDRAIDHRVDVYAAGIMLFEMIAGEVPFKAENTVQTLLQHLIQPVPPFAESLGVPAYLRAVVEKALEKDVDARYSTAGEFRAAVHEARIRLEREGPTVANASVDSLELRFAMSVARLAETKAKQKTRVLCLDDNEMILTMMKHLLEKEGFEVFTTQSADQIHEYLFEKDVKLLVSDVEMPGLPGTKVCKMLKDSLPDLKIILFSNIPERDLMRASQASKADDWISKNTKPDEWIRKVRAVLAGTPATQGPV